MPQRAALSPAVRSHLGGLVGDRDEGGLGHRGSEAETEGEGEKGAQTALPGERMGHRLAQGKQPHLKTSHEQGKPDDDEPQADDGAVEIGEGLLQDNDLEERDDQHDRGQIAHSRYQQLEQAPKIGWLVADFLSPPLYTFVGIPGNGPTSTTAVTRHLVVPATRGRAG